LRDYFAAKAMQGWVASSPVISGEPMNGSAEMAEQIAGASFILADAMLKAREA
jgi:nickel-dependent lactate racemase